MLFRFVVMLSVAALVLTLAACAETGAVMATSAADEAATIAATQAAFATTQAIEQLESSSTRMSVARAGPYQLRGIPKLPPVRKGRIVIFTPDWIIIQRNGKRTFVRRENYAREEQEDSSN